MAGKTLSVISLQLQCGQVMHFKGSYFVSLKQSIPTVKFQGFFLFFLKKIKKSSSALQFSLILS